MWTVACGESSGRQFRRFFRTKVAATRFAKHHGLAAPYWEAA